MTRVAPPLPPRLALKNDLACIGFNNSALKRIVIALCAAASACSEDPVTAKRESIEQGGARASSQPVQLEHRFVAAFDVRLQLDSAGAAPGWFRLLASARLLVPMSGFSLELTAIDLDESALLPPKQRLRRAILPIQQTIRPANDPFAVLARDFVVVTPGVYQFVAVAKREIDPQSHARMRGDVQDVAAAWLRISVDEHGRVRQIPSEGTGESTANLGESRLAAGTQSVLPSLIGEQLAQLSPPTPASLSCAAYTGYALFVHVDPYRPTEIRPVVAATISGNFVATSGQQSAVPYSTTSGPDGDFTLPYMQGRRFEGSVQLSNQDVRVGSGGSVHSTAVAVAESALCGGIGGHVLSWNEAGEVWSTMARVAERARTRFGRQRPQDLRVDIGGGNAAYYNVEGDRVHIPASMVWGQLGTFIAGHEYGHAFHHKALGGLPVPSICPSSRPLTGAYNLGCAYAEGFGNFFSSLLLDDVIFAPLYEESFEKVHLEANYTTYLIPLGYWCNNQVGHTPCPPAQLTSDGARNESAVAGFFYDLLDDENTLNEPPGLDDDFTAYPYSWLGDVIATCEVLESSGWRRANGVDDLIYCLGKTLGGYHAAGYFPSRLVAPLDWRATATDPPNYSAKNVRHLWQSVLFYHGVP